MVKVCHGLDLNNEKINVVKIWVSRDRSIPWQDKVGFKWATTFAILGIYYGISRMGEIAVLNIFRKMGEIIKLLRM